MASGDEGRGDSEGHVRHSHVRDRGEGACLCLQLLVPECYDCSSDHGSPFPLRWRVGQDKKGVLKIVLHTDLADLEKPQSSCSTNFAAIRCAAQSLTIIDQKHQYERIPSHSC